MWKRSQQLPLHPAWSLLHLSCGLLLWMFDLIVFTGPSVSSCSSEQFLNLRCFGFIYRNLGFLSLRSYWARSIDVTTVTATEPPKWLNDCFCFPSFKGSMPFCVEALSCCRAALILLLTTFLSEKKKISVADRAQDRKQEAGGSSTASRYRSKQESVGSWEVFVIVGWAVAFYVATNLFCVLFHLLWTCWDKCLKKWMNGEMHLTSGSIKNSAKLLDMKRRDMMMAMSSFMAHYSVGGLCVCRQSVYWEEIMKSRGDKLSYLWPYQQLCCHFWLLSVEFSLMLWP